MALASGIAKQVRYKVESTFGTPPGAASAQLLRRVESSVDLSKDTYQSDEIRDDYQISDYRHGVRRVAGNIKGELSAKTYADFIAAALRRDFSAVTALSSLSITIAGTAPSYTLTRGSGSYLTDGLKVGDVVRLTAGTFNSNNLNKNILVVTLSANVLGGIVLNGSTLTAEGPIASATLSIVGKKTYTPTSGHTDKSFSIEHFYSDIAQSELFTGCKASAIDINLPPTGMGTIDIAFMGKDIVTATAAYFTSPTAATSTGVVAAVNGALIVNGTQIAICTGLSLKIDGGYSADPVIGANTMPAIYPGRVNVSGQFTAYFQDATLRDNFVNEDEITLVVALTASNAAAADFIAFSLPRIKLGGAGKSDGEKGLIATYPFQALFNGAGGSGTKSEQTTLVVQDSQA